MQTPRVFTAFGERIAGPTTLDRFGYVGDEGYQGDSALPFLHVGARYYDPMTGRFLQRDPAGIVGGLNVYAYADNSPTWLIDPDGYEPGPVPGYYGLGGAAAAKEIAETLKLLGQTGLVGTAGYATGRACLIRS